MKLLPFICCLFLAHCSAARTEADSLVITEGFFKKDFVIYTGQHDIVKIYVPFNQFNFQDDVDITASSSSSEEQDVPRTVFFVEADVTNGKKTDQGLYVYKNGTTAKLLNNGRDVVATNENVVYIGASDGIYKYNEADNTVTKYGSVTDDIIQLAHNNVTNDVYYLTANHEVFKLNTDSTSGVKVTSIKDVQALAFGFEGNLYYYDSKKTVNVLTNDADAVPKKFEGLPSSIDKITLISPLYGIEEGSVLIVDKRVYRLNPDATVRESVIRLEVEPTAFAPQPTLFQYYAKDKKLYEFNVVAIFLTSVLGELKNYVTDHLHAIRELTGRTKNNLF